MWGMCACGLCTCIATRSSTAKCSTTRCSTARGCDLIHKYKHTYIHIHTLTCILKIQSTEQSNNQLIKQPSNLQNKQSTKNTMYKHTTKQLNQSRICENVLTGKRNAKKSTKLSAYVKHVLSNILFTSTHSRTILHTCALS